MHCVCAQTNVEGLGAGPQNPFGNGFRAVERELATELQAKRRTDPHSGRTWKIKNPQCINPITREPPPLSHSACAVCPSRASSDA